MMALCPAEQGGPIFAGNIFNPIPCVGGGHGLQTSPEDIRLAD